MHSWVLITCISGQCNLPLILSAFFSLFPARTSCLFFLSSPFFLPSDQLSLSLSFSSTSGHTLVPLCDALKITRLSVPKAVENGSAVFLSCSFNLEGEVLYSVKWYRDYVEFFRFLPSNAPNSSQPVNLKGAYVDVSIDDFSSSRSYTQSNSFQFNTTEYCCIIDRLSHPLTSFN